MRLLSLAVVGPNATSGTPSVDQVRRRLGGRATSSPGAGQLVTLKDSGSVGVVVFVASDEWHVLSELGVVKKAGAAACTALSGASPALTALAADAHAFAALHEGQRVRFAAAGGAAAEGTLVEKCRYGGIVLSDDQRLIGVGFRKLWARVADGDVS